MGTSFTFIIEVICVIGNVAMWLGPLSQALRKGMFNIFHPQFIMPCWIVYFILNTMMQKWLLWIPVAPGYGMLRTTNEALLFEPTYLILPLLITAICAPFYHLGVRSMAGVIYRSPDGILLNRFKRVVQKGQEAPFLGIGVIIAGVLWMPNYFLPNEEFGTFWTYPIAMTVASLSFMIFCINKYVGVVSSLFVIITSLVLRSKASFVYPLLPIFVYYASRLEIRKSMVWTIIVIFPVLWALSLGFENDLNSTIVQVLHRDYSFETFAALVDQSSVLGMRDGPYSSWMLAEILEGIPSILFPFKSSGLYYNPSKQVALCFLMRDYQSLPNAYFSRFFLFSGYYDLGILGAALNALGCGAFLGWCWSRTKQEVIKHGYLWPIFLYIPIVTVTVYFIASGAIAYGLINGLIPTFLILVIFGISRLLMRSIPGSLSRVTTGNVVAQREKEF